jgi:hypothetical protein
MMKKANRIAISAILPLMTCVTEVSASQFEQAMSERASALSTALNVPLTSTSQVWTVSLFPSNGVISTNSCQFVKKEDSAFFTVSSNAQVVAHGELFERSSYETACSALFFSLVKNNLSIEMITEGYKLLPNGVGDFRIIGIKVDEATGNDLDDPSVFHFARGAKAVSLFGKDGTNVRPIAETLDGLLKR